MAFKGIVKRNYNRTQRYGSGWRQLYYDKDGMCEMCQSVDDLEIHEEGDGIVVTMLNLLCRECHIHKKHGGAIAHLERKYSSLLAQDISDEIRSCGGLKSWKRVYGIKEKV